MRRWSIPFILFVLVGWIGSLAAPPVYGGSADDARKERVHKLIVARLANGLNLSQQEAQALGDVLKKSRQRKRQLRLERRQLTAQLRQDTLVGDKKRIEATLKKLEKVKGQLDRSNDVMFEEVKTMLDPNQLAQFVLIMDEIRHEVRAVRRRGRRQRVQPPPGNYPAIQSPQQNYTNQPQAPRLNPGLQRGLQPGPVRNGILVND